MIRFVAILQQAPLKGISHRHAAPAVMTWKQPETPLPRPQHILTPGSFRNYPQQTRTLTLDSTPGATDLETTEGSSPMITNTLAPGYFRNFYPNFSMKDTIKASICLFNFQRLANWSVK